MAETAIREPQQTTADRIGKMLTHPGLAVALLLAVTLLTYWPVRTCDFITLDDPVYVSGNPQVKAGLTLESVAWAFSTGHGANWHPLTWLSHMLDTTLFGTGPAGPHVVNLLFHAANAGLLFWLLRRLTAAHWKSLLVAALFALHPQHVESVAWVSERKDVLSTFFFLLTLLAYHQHVNRPATQRAQLNPQPGETSPRIPHPASRTPHPAPRIPHPASRTPFWYCAALLLFALGLMSKPMLVTLPFVLLLLDYWPLKRIPEYRLQLSTPGRLVWEKAPFFALTLAFCAVTFLVQKHGGAVQPLASLALASRLENALVAGAWYLGKTFWPTQLAVPYPRAGDWSWLQVGGAAALLIGLSLGVLGLRRRLPFAVTGWFWFLGTLVPVVGLVQVGEQFVADRYTYIPSIGAFLACVWGVGMLLERAGESPTGRLQRWLGWAAGLAGVGLTATCAVQTRIQVSYWQNTETLMQHTLALTRDNWMAHFALAYDQFRKDRPTEAVAEYRAALKLNPLSPHLLTSIGDAYYKQEEFAQAITSYEESLRLRPDDAETHSNLGAALDKAGRSREARQQYEEALRLAPENALAHYRLGNSLVKSGRTEEAIEQFRQAVRDRSGYTEALNNLGVALFQQGRLNEAIEQFKAVAQLQPDHANARCNLGNACAAQGKWQQAAEHYREAVSLQGDFVEARYGLARALARLGKQEQAVIQLKETLRLKPGHAGAQQLLKGLESSP